MFCQIISNKKLRNFIPSIIMSMLKYLWIKDNPCIGECERVSLIRSLPNLKKSYPSINQNNFKLVKNIEMSENRLSVRAMLLVYFLFFIGQQ